MERPVSRLSKIISIIVMVGISILFALFIIELFFYFKPDALPAVIRTEYFLSDSASGPPGTVLDSQVGFKFRPDLSDFEVPFGNNSYLLSTTSLGYDQVGFRDDGIDGDPYAIVLGDSMVVCVGVEMQACWVEQLEQQTGLDFINMGVSGYGQDLQYRMFKTYGLPLHPQKVIWVFFPNDLIQAWRFEQFGQGGVNTGVFQENTVLSWLAQHSTIFITLSYFWYERNFFGNLYFGDPTVANNATLSWWLAYTDPSVSEVSRGLERTQSIILDAYQETTSQNAAFVVVILPFREQIIYSDSDHQQIFNAASQSIVNFGKAHNIPVIDLTEAMTMKAAQAPDTFFFKDSHLKVEGNKLLSEILTEELIKHGIIPSKN